MITEYVLQQLKYLKQFSFGKVTYKTFNGVYTWYVDSKALYFKENGIKYFSDKGNFLGNVIL